MGALPEHILIIPDGNRRWAKRFWNRFWAWIRRKDLAHGHLRGAETFQEILQEALRLKIPYVTIWACTPTNLTERPWVEIKVLYEVLERAFNELAASKEVHVNQVRVQVIGRWRDDSLCPPSLQAAIERCMLVTADHENFHLTILVAYSGMEEMEDAISHIVKDASFLRGCGIDRELIKNYLWAKDLPDVDLIIRTGVEGDPHNSDGVMMWHTVFSQYYFTKTYWPAFTGREFCRAVQDFNRRQRRYGK